MHRLFTKLPKSGICLARSSNGLTHSSSSALSTLIKSLATENITIATRDYHLATVQHASPLPLHDRVTMPNLSPTMKQGRIVSWEKREGDFIGEGEVLAKIETDKSTMEMETPDEGYVAKILLGEGSEAPINELIGILVPVKEDIAAFMDYTETSREENTKVQEETVDPSLTADQAREYLDSEEKNTVEESKPSSRALASPLARRIALEEGVDLEAVAGSGPMGRITVEDVRNAARAAKVQSSIQSSGTIDTANTTKCNDNGCAQTTAKKMANNKKPPSVKPTLNHQYTDHPVTNMRQTIAKRLLVSKQTSPHYYLSIDVNMDQVLELRNQMNEQTGGQVKLSVNDFIIKASAMALKKVPECNSQWGDNCIREFHNVDISIAVAIDGGIITPIITDADKKTLSTINNDVNNLAHRAQSNQLTLTEFQGGTFGVSNLGTYGITNFSAVINPPMSSILACGRSTPKVVPCNKAAQGIKTSHLMSVTLSCDHRVVDGAVGAEWLREFREFMEDPIKMVL